MKYFLVDSTRTHSFAERFADEVTTTDTPADADAILVFGGDGAMLRAIDDYSTHEKPFIGIHAGTLGYLMNNISNPQTCYEHLCEVEFETLWTLEAEVETATGSSKVSGFNDIWVERATGQMLRMRVWINDILQPPVLGGDGILVCTPQGSTGYNLALRGKAISPGEPILQLTPMACVVNKAPLGSVIMSDRSVIRVDFEQIEKRPGVLYHDGIQLDAAPVHHMTVRKGGRTVQLGFIKEFSFRDKVLAWQFHV